MSKPSIFSSSYERERKKRRRKRIALVLTVLILGSALLFKGGITELYKKNVSSKSFSISGVLNKFKYKNSDKKLDKKETVKVNQDKTTQDKKNDPKVVDSVYAINMPDSKQVKVSYEKNGDDKKIKSVDLNGLDGDYNISSTGKAVVVYDKNGQTMTYIDADGNQQDITYNSYTSSGGTTFTRTAVLQNNPTYIWCSSPKFIDDNSIVFVSQVPWFDNRTDKYIWKYSIKDKAFENTNISGSDVKLNSVNENGLEAVVNGNTQYLK
ncbi:MAG: hypothetical protein Q8936_16205 [Bacillota bacterium]|nr:hypothetical protein [Bacillota bacterium]